MTPGPSEEEEEEQRSFQPLLWSSDLGQVTFSGRRRGGSHGTPQLVVSEPTVKVLTSKLSHYCFFREFHQHNQIELLRWLTMLFFGDEGGERMHTDQFYGFVCWLFGIWRVTAMAHDVAARENSLAHRAELELGPMLQLRWRVVLFLVLVAAPQPH